MMIPQGFDIEPWMTTRALGRSLEVHDRIDSTNDRARALAREGAPHGFTVIAHEQTAGRGQRGRSWHSPPGSGLYASFVVRPSMPARHAATLPLLAGLAVREALASFTRAPLGLKWPNDVLVAVPPHRGRKVSGILVEAAVIDGQVASVVIGVGINVHATPMPPDLARTAIALDGLPLTAAAPTVPQVFAATALHLETWLDRARAEGMTAVLAEWSLHALGAQERVEVEVDGQVHEGTLLPPAEDGALEIETVHGRQRFYRGELRIPGVPHPRHG